MKYIWSQTDGRKWKVETNSKKGTILVTDADGNVLTDKKDLSEVVIKLIETNFFNAVAVRVSEVGDIPKTSVEEIKKCEHCPFDPMFI